MCTRQSRSSFVFKKNHTSSWTYSYRRSAFPMARRRNSILAFADWIRYDRLFAFFDVFSPGPVAASTLLSEI